jgi:NADH dehydrogenase
MNANGKPRVVIVGAGFGGLSVANALADAPVEVTIIDRHNYHLFQPLLYQVATASLSPAEIAQPIRSIVRDQANARVLLDEVTGVDTAKKTVRTAGGHSVPYDHLICATGARHSYFGKDHWEQFAPGIKTVDDGTRVRAKILLAFERAEGEADKAKRAALLTFVIVGGGPTGVEMAGTMIELARRGIPRDFRMIDTRTARVMLIEAADRLLQAYPPALSQRAKQDLEKMGVEVLVNRMVVGIDSEGVMIRGGNANGASSEERITAENVVWAAGVKASPLGATLGAPIDRSGRVIVQSDLTLAGHPEVFIVGDLAAANDGKTGQAIPGIAPAAMQMGRYAARVILAESSGRSNPAQRRPFHYVDKGMLATIGRARAVGLIFGMNVKGLFAWLMWAGVHIMYLIGFRNRLIVFLQWAWAYLIFQRGARLITGAPKMEIRTPRNDEDESGLGT